jgi:hypothetical protein
MNKELYALYDRIMKLEDRVLVLEEENIGLTNELYELLNDMDILKDPKWAKMNFNYHE